MAKAKTKTPDLFDKPLKVGDHVLLGGTYASMPGHWFLGEILWLEGESLLVRRWTANGQKWQQEESVYTIRAVGTIAELVAIQEEARKAVKELTDVVHEAESALGSARAAVHNKLQDLAKGGLKVVPFDGAADATHTARIQAAMNAYDEQEALENA